MHPRSFISLIEEEYEILHGSASEAVSKYGFKDGEKPIYVCSEVQRFRNWLAYAIRSADLTAKDEKVSPEDVLIYAASARSSASPFLLLHPKLVNALALYERWDFYAIFGPMKMETFEKGTNLTVSVCQFEVCYSHCSGVRSNASISARSASERDSTYYPL